MRTTVGSFALACLLSCGPQTAVEFLPPDMNFALSPPLLVAESAPTSRSCEWDPELDVFFPAEPRDDPDRPLNIEISSFAGRGVTAEGEIVVADLGHVSGLSPFELPVAELPVTIRYSEGDLTTRDDCVGATPVSNQPPGGWVYSFLLNDETACAATGQELDEAARGESSLTDVCQLPGRVLARGLWEEKLAALEE